MNPAKKILCTFLLVLTAALYGCQTGASADPFSKCKYGKPQPVFPNSYSEVDSQYFEIKGMSGLEKVWFVNGLYIELLQEGCDKARQVFHFRLKGNFSRWEDWLQLSASQLEYLSAISEKHLELGMWAQAIRQHKEQIPLDEKVEIQPGYFVKVDKVLGADYVILIVEVGEQ